MSDRVAAAMDTAGLRRRRRPEGDESPAAGAEISEARESQAIVASSTDALALEGQDRGFEAVAVNPYWSEKAKMEARLQAARPSALDQYSAEETSGQGSGSTELRPEEERLSWPQGYPQSFGPRDTATAGHPVDGRGLPHPGDHFGGVATSADFPPGPVPAEERAGMRPGERLVVETMRNMLAEILQQNQQLMEQNRAFQSRLEKLEDDMTMQSASSGGQRDVPETIREFVDLGNPERFSSSALGYYIGGSAKAVAEPGEGAGPSKHQGDRAGSTGLSLPNGPASFDDVLVASFDGRGGSLNRDLSPPPPPPRGEARRPTTPGGTEIPAAGTPPRTPTPTFGSSSQGLDVRPGPLDLQVCPSSTQFSQHASDRPSGPSQASPSLYAFSSSVSGGGPWKNQLPPPSSPNSGGRDQFAPGDRVWWTVPFLEDPTVDGDAATRAAAWLELLNPIMNDLSFLSGLWWKRILEEAHCWYQKWCEAPAVERGLIRPQMSAELTDMRYWRLESRAYAMLQNAVPSLVREELVSSRSIHCVGLLFHVLRLYQPGGLQERTRLLDQLSNPGKAVSASEGVAKLRAWHRALARAVTMQVSIPDSSILLRGLDSASEGLLQKFPQTAFRCSTVRNPRGPVPLQPSACHQH